MGIEPTLAAWEAAVLPLNYTRLASPDFITSHATLHIRAGGRLTPKMDHGTPLIATIVGGLGLAFLFGALANRLRMSPIVSCLLAGVAVGPFTPGFVADQSIANELAEIGVILLMFGVGMHFSFRDLLAVRAIALPGAVVQIGAATFMGVGLGRWLGWSWEAGIIFGLSLSVASTVVLLRALEERGLVTSGRGRIAVGWLIVEDIAMVLALVLLPALGDSLVPARDSAAAGAAWSAIGLTVAKVAGFVAVMYFVGRRVIPLVLDAVAEERELFRLAVLAIALGAFFAGMVLGESELSQRAAEEGVPLREAFAVLFFVAVGMLFDPAVVLREPLALAATLFIVLIGKSVAAFVIVLLFRHTVGVGMTIAASLSQIGEFSFILAGLGVTMGLLPEQGQDLVLAAAMISIILNPLAFALASRLEPAIASRVGRAGRGEPLADAGRLALNALEGHIVLVGSGRVGGLVAAALKKSGLPFVVVESDAERVGELRERGIPVVEGNAARREILRIARPETAARLVLAIPNAFEAGRIVKEARKANPRILVVARAHSDAGTRHLEELGADAVIMGERQTALEMIAEIERLGSPATSSPGSS